MRVLAVSLPLLLTGPAALASAAIVVRTGTGYRLEAAPGEANRVVVAVGDDDVVLQVTGAPVGVQVSGGDGDDELILTGEIVEAFGDAGQDLLVGGPGEETLTGGDGADDLRGGDGDDFLDGGRGDDALDGGAGTDLVSYGSVTVPVVVDLADPGPDGTPGERDELTAVENVRGGTAADRLLGDRADDYLTGGGGVALFGVRVTQDIAPDDIGSEEGEGEDENSGTGVEPVVAAVRLLDVRGRVLGRGTRTARGVAATVPVRLTPAARAALRRNGGLRAVLAVGRGARLLVLIR